MNTSRRDETHQIRNAICAHAEWKGKLSEGIRVGHLEQSSAEVTRDDACVFGKWIAEFSCTADTTSEEAARKCEMVKSLHARFHGEAGKIVAAIEHGNRGEAQALFDAETFHRLTNSLVLTLDDWRKDFTGKSKAYAA